MADIKVYTGGIPATGFSTNLGTSSEAESGVTPGDADATDPKVVNQGGPTQGKTYSQSASENFLMDGSYKTSMEIGRPGSGKTVNPNDLSNADHC